MNDKLKKLGTVLDELGLEIRIGKDGNGNYISFTDGSDKVSYKLNSVVGYDLQHENYRRS